MGVPFPSCMQCLPENQKSSRSTWISCVAVASSGTEDLRCVAISGSGDSVRIPRRHPGPAGRGYHKSTLNFVNKHIGEPGMFE